MSWNDQFRAAAAHLGQQVDNLRSEIWKLPLVVLAFCGGMLFAALIFTASYFIIGDK
jgi:hypothetical protein